MDDDFWLQEEFGKVLSDQENSYFKALIKGLFSTETSASASKSAKNQPKTDEEKKFSTEATNLLVAKFRIENELYPLLDSTDCSNEPIVSLQNFLRNSPEKSKQK